MMPQYLFTLLPLLAVVTARSPADIRKVHVRRGTCAHKPHHHNGTETGHGNGTSTEHTGERNLTRPDHHMYGPGSNSSSAPAVQMPIASSSAVASLSSSISVEGPAAAPTTTPTAAIFAPNVTVSSSSAVSVAASSAEPATDSTSTSTSAAEASSSAAASSAESSAEAPTSSAAATSSSAAPEPSASAAAESGDADAKLFVKLHNDFRAQYGAPPVSWDSELASFAASYAPICQMTHSSGPYGENLAGGAGGGYDITSAFNAWADEAKYYDWTKPGVLEATNEQGQEVGLGHFTQVVWKATDKIGCAKVSCADGTLFTGYGESLFVVCEYSPAGNVYMSGDDSNSLFVENVGQKV